MPDGQEPVQATTVEHIEPTRGLTVYYATTVEDISNNSWELDKNLICLGITPTNNIQIGSAIFTVLPFSNSLEDQAEGLERMRSGAPDYYRVSKGYVDLDPHYIKVTDKLNGKEFPIFYGYIDSVSQNFNTGMLTVYALSYAGLLDTVDLFGAWWRNIGGLAMFYPMVEPIFNPDGNGNKYSATLIDETKVIQGKTTANLFTVQDVIENILYHATASDVWLESPSKNINPWKFISRIYGEGIIEYGAGAKELLQSSYPVDNYSYLGTSFYSALKGLVERVGDLALTETIAIEQDAKPKLKIVRLQ